MNPPWRRLGRIAAMLMGSVVAPPTSVFATPARHAAPAAAASAPAPQASSAAAHRAAAHEPARAASAALPFKRAHKEEVADRPNRGGR